MAKLNILTLGSSKTYTKESLLGGGAVVGKNVTISSITPIEGGNRVTFSYTLDNGTVKTSTMDVKDGVSITSISVDSNNNLVCTMSDGTEYKSKIDLLDNVYTKTETDNLLKDKAEKTHNHDDVYAAKDTEHEHSNKETLDKFDVNENGKLTFNGDVVTPEASDLGDYLKKTEAQSTYVAKETGKGLSENDFTTVLKDAYDKAVEDSHTHTNKSVIDKFSEGSGGKLLYDGQSIEADLSTVYKKTETYSQTEADNKFVAKETGKGLSTNDYTTEEKDKLASLENYDDVQIKTQIQAVANGLMDSVGYSADYKTIDIIAKNGVKKSVNVAPIISHASITELSDVDTTNKATGKALVYNATTSKHEYADVSGTDEKVKMDASTDAKYLGELLDNVTIANENGELKVKKLDGQEVTITEINYLKGLTMNVMDLVNMFSNGGVKIINTPVATYAELLTLDKSSFIEGISYLVYVLADENHDNAKTTYLVDKDSETPTYFGFADSQRDFTTNPIDLATEITGKLGIANMDSDAIKALFTVDDTYKTETTTNNAFSTHGAKALYDELILAIGNKANNSDLTAHKDDTDIHVSTEDRTKWDKVVDKVDKIEGKGLSANDYTNEEKSLVATIEDKINKTSIATALDDTVTDEQVASALLAKTELDKKIDKTSIATTLSSESTNDDVVGAKLAYDELQKTELATKEQFATASGESITVNDSVDGKIRDLKLYGKSEQKQYSGKNLLDCSGLTEQTLNGVTFTPVYENGMLQYIKANGTATDDCNFTLTNKSITEDGKTYRIVGCPSGGSSNTYRLSFWGGRSPEYGSGTIFTNEDLNATYKYLYINIVSGYTCNNLVFKPMITTDLEATYDDFEPYVGGIQSPNPSYPQEIKSVVNPVVKSCGKNLCGNLISDKVIDFNSGVLINMSGYLTTDYIEVEAGTTYTISNASKGNEKWYYDKDKKPIKYMGLGSQITVTIPDNAKYIRCSTTVELKDLFQIEKGSVATSYEPYKETTATLPYTLNAIPVESGGNVTIDGQEYIADYVDIEKKKLVKNVGIADLGVFDYTYDTEKANKRFFTQPSASYNIKGYNYSKIANVICTGLIANSSDNLTLDPNSYDNSVAIDPNNPPYIIIRCDKYTNSDDFKNNMSGVKLFYEVATPTAIDLTDSEVQAFKELSTYYPTTNVFVASEQLNGYAEFKYPTTDVSGIASKNEAKIAEIEKTFGSTDISAIGDGTVTGAISAENESLSSIGKCKNLLKPTLQTTTLNGVTCTRNVDANGKPDGTYTLNGTCTDDNTIIYFSSKDKNTLDILNNLIGKTIKVIGVDDDYYNESEFMYQLWTDTTDAIKNNKIAIINGSITNYNVAIIINSGVSFDGIIIKPMLTTNLNATYDDFVPYTGDGETLASDVAEIKKDLGGLTFSASGTTLTITDGTNTWTLGANS